jgi:hypothetical protein
VALFDAMRKKQREGRPLTHEEQRAAVGGAIVTHSDPMLTPPKLVRKTTFDPNGGSGTGESPNGPVFAGPDEIVTVHRPDGKVVRVPKPVADLASDPNPTTCVEPEEFDRIAAGAAAGPPRAEGRIGETMPYGEHDVTHVCFADGTITVESTTLPGPAERAERDARYKALGVALALYRRVLLMVKAALKQLYLVRHDRVLVDEKIEVMRLALCGLPKGWNVIPGTIFGGAFRDALLEIEEALKSISFSPPENVFLHLGRIKEALDLLPKGWEVEPSERPADGAAVAEPLPDQRRPHPDKTASPMGGVPGYDAEGVLTDPSYRGT